MKLNYQWIFRRIRVFLFCIALIWGLTGEWPDRSAEDFVFDSVVRNRRFDFVGWEAKALGGKALYATAPSHGFLDSQTQKEIVFEYFDLLAGVQWLEGEIDRLYADPNVAAPTDEAADLNRQLEIERAQLEKTKPLAEGVIQEQIATVLAEQELDWLGRTFPPVELEFTPLPAMLVVSPRDRIEAIKFISLEHGLDTATRVAMENALDSSLDLSTLVVDIGGLAAYPAMMLESLSLEWVLETGAHEWTHHYLTLHPLGILYDQSPEMRTINETTASIVGNEIGFRVLDKFYPGKVTPTPIPGTGEESEPPAFDFRAEMRVTRLGVDERLKNGEIEQAEVYMEERRLIFWENGYRIRKINQAYFAFYGAYADEPGAPGADPVGPAVQKLYAKSPSLAAFLETIAPVTSFEELQALID